MATNQKLSFWWLLSYSRALHIGLIDNEINVTNKPRMNARRIGIIIRAEGGWRCVLTNSACMQSMIFGLICIIVVASVSHGANVVVVVVVIYLARREIYSL